MQINRFNSYNNPKQQTNPKNNQPAFGIKFQFSKEANPMSVIKNVEKQENKMGLMRMLERIGNLMTAHNENLTNHSDKINRGVATITEFMPAEKTTGGEIFIMATAKDNVTNREFEVSEAYAGNFLNDLQKQMVAKREEIDLQNKLTCLFNGLTKEE